MTSYYDKKLSSKMDRRESKAYYKQ